MTIVALFSTGKDSLVMMDKLLQTDNVVYPVYLFYARLNYIKQRLLDYEKFYNIKIDTYEHYENYKAKKNNVYGSSLDTWEEEYKYSKDCMEWLLKKYNADKIAFGYKKTDNLIRRGIISEKKQGVKHYGVYPVADYNDKQIWEYIKKRKIPYPFEYDLGFKHEFSNFMTKGSLCWLKQYYPNDFENLKYDFPLIEGVMLT